MPLFLGLNFSETMLLMPNKRIARATFDVEQAIPLLLSSLDILGAP